VPWEVISPSRAIWLTFLETATQAIVNLD